MEAEIRIKYESDEEAKAVARAVSPDNLRVPPGLTVKTFADGKCVVTKIVCKRPLKTLMSTIDDLLQCMQVAEKALEVAKRSRSAR